MSYARWGSGGSDVYIFTTKRGDGHYAVECCGCIATKLDTPYKDIFGIEHEYELSSFYGNTREEIDKHLQEHLDKGDCVLPDTFSRLEIDYPDATKLIDDYETELDNG